MKGCLGGSSGALCQRKLLRAEQRAVTQLGPVQYCCPSGLVKILVPVFINGRYAGMLLAGPFALHSLDGDRLAKLVGCWTNWGSATVRHNCGRRGVTRRACHRPNAGQRKSCCGCSACILGNMPGSNS